MPNIAQAIKGSYSLKEGYGVVYNPQTGSGYQTIAPPINKGYTVAEFNSLYGDRLREVWYYTTPPSGS